MKTIKIELLGDHAFRVSYDNGKIWETHGITGGEQMIRAGFTIRFPLGNSFVKRVSAGPADPINYPLTLFTPEEHKLYNADPNCHHETVSLWSGVKCKHCPGWFCY